MNSEMQMPGGVLDSGDLPVPRLPISLVQGLRRWLLGWWGNDVLVLGFILVPTNVLNTTFLERFGEAARMWLTAFVVRAKSNLPREEGWKPLGALQGSRSPQPLAQGCTRPRLPSTALAWIPLSFSL